MQIPGAHVFRAVHHPDLDTLCLVATREFLKMRARYLRLVAQNNKADRVNVTSITVVASIDPELLEDLIDMEECYALLRMRPLSISWAECSVVISCGTVDYDKSG
jgi:hypothetical protein